MRGNYRNAVSLEGRVKEDSIPVMDEKGRPTTSFVVETTRAVSQPNGSVSRESDAFLIEVDPKSPYVRDLKKGMRVTVDGRLAIENTHEPSKAEGTFIKSERILVLGNRNPHRRRGHLEGEIGDDPVLVMSPTGRKTLSFPLDVKRIGRDAAGQQTYDSDQFPVELLVDTTYQCPTLKKQMPVIVEGFLESRVAASGTRVVVLVARRVSIVDHMLSGKPKAIVSAS